MDNKKKIIVSVIGILLLLVMVVGVTYAMFTYTGTGSKENVITTGNISVSYAESKVVNLTNTYPMSDAEGIANADPNNEMSFTVTGNITGNVTINYAIGLDSIEEGATLKEKYVKIYMLKGDSVVNTFEEGKGRSIRELRSSGVDGVIDKYVLHTDNFVNTGTTSHQYTIKAWVSGEYNLPTTDTSNGNVHGNTTGSETFKFKIKVVATDNAMTLKETYSMVGTGNEATNVQAPDQITNMVPVYYDENNKVWRVADIDNTDNHYKWYNYNNKEWANAVLVNETASTCTTCIDTITKHDRSYYTNQANVGEAVSMDDINVMLVWIPRFSAGTIPTLNATEKLNPPAIDITFVGTSTPALDAFTFDGAKAGIWVGKFELGHTTLGTSTTANNLGCTLTTCALTTTNGLQVKPNVKSLRWNNVSNFFYAIRNMEVADNAFGLIANEIDTHMMKNSEWGAVAYLTQSNYGRCTNNVCTDIGINNNSGHMTGYGAPAGSAYTATKGTYETDLGQDSSTTGNIYGIYDMSGGSWEYVMGNFDNTIGLSGFSSIPESKYINIYTGTSYIGHALSETASWYSDINRFVSTNTPWFIRGGGPDNGDSAGVFYFLFNAGSNNGHYGSRLTITK